MSLLILCIGSTIIVVNFYRVFFEDYAVEVERDAKDIFSDFSINTMRIRQKCYEIAVKKQDDLYSQEKCYSVCKEISTVSPFIKEVNLEYAPSFFRGKRAFCPAYDVEKKMFKNYSDTAATIHRYPADYIHEDGIFSLIYNSNGERTADVTENIYSGIRTYDTRLNFYLKDTRNDSVFVIINVILDNSYKWHICSSVKNWEKTDSLVIFNADNGLVYFNTYSENIVNVYNYMSRLLSEKDYTNFWRIMHSRQDSSVVVPQNDFAWAFIHDPYSNTGMICQAGYEKFKDKKKDFAIIISTYIGAILLMIILGGYLTRRAVRDESEIHYRRKELEMASVIQQYMLPEASFNVPHVRINARIIPARKVGGDLYYYFTRNNYLFFCIGDISGKGLSSALFMSRTISLFSCVSQYAFRADDIAEQINKELCQNNESSMFVTMFIGILNLKTGEMQYCNAGHDEPIYWNGLDSSRPCYLSTSDNIPLGVDEEEPYTQHELYLKAGSQLFLYTDGVTEAKRKDLKMYGEQRLLECFTKHRDDTLQSICSNVLADIRAFVDDNQQSDDITMLSITVKHIDSTIVLKDDVAELKKLPDFFHNIANVLIYSPEELIQIRMAIDEVMTNCIRYAYVDTDVEKESRLVSLRAYTANGQLIFVITDSGIPFNPLTYEKHSLEDILNLDIDDMEIGGLGIPLMKKSFDELYYERTSDKNILTLKKYLNKEVHGN